MAHPILYPSSASLSKAIRLLGDHEPGLVDNIRGRVGRSWLPLAAIVAELRAREPDLFDKIMDQVIVRITASSKKDPEFIEKYGAVPGLDEVMRLEHQLHRDDMMVILSIPASLTIGDSAFYGCTGLTEVNFPTSLTTIGNCAFYGCTGLTGLHLPPSLTTIRSYSFSGCTGLTDIIHFPASLTTIGSYSFSRCTGLTEVHFPTSLKIIVDDAFYKCTELTEVHFPDESVLTEIGHDAFRECTGLVDVYCSAEFREKFRDKFPVNVHFSLI